MATYSKYLTSMALIPNTATLPSPLQAAATPNYTAIAPSDGEPLSPIQASRIIDLDASVADAGSEYEDAVSELMTKVSVSYV